MNKHSARKGYIYIFIAGVFWGTIGTGLKLLTDRGLSEIQASFFLQAGAFIVILPYVIFTCGLKSLRIKPRLFLILFLTGLFSEALFDYCYASAIERMGVAISAVVMYLAPVFVLIASRLLFGETVTRNKKIAVVVNLAGCFLTVTGGSLKGSSFSVAGLLFGIVTAICYGVITISDKYTAGQAPPPVIAFYILLCGFVTMSLLNRCWTFDSSILTPANFGLGIGAGIFAAFLPKLFFAGGLACDIEASKAPVIASVEVIVAAILGVVLFREKLGVFNILGIAIVILSIVIMNRKETPET